MVVATPKPRLVKLEISAPTVESFSTNGMPRKAAHYVIKVNLGGITGVVAPLVGKQPPDSHVWMLQGDVPGFVKAEQPFYAGGPVWRISSRVPLGRATRARRTPHPATAPSGRTLWPHLATAPPFRTFLPHLPSAPFVRTSLPHLPLNVSLFGFRPPGEPEQDETTSVDVSVSGTDRRHQSDSECASSGRRRSSAGRARRAAARRYAEASRTAAAAAGARPES